jgi:lipoprotein-anchoring transpeptidase ErfK/SrfK
MWNSRVAAICITMIGGSISFGASAQECEFISWGCQGPFRSQQPLIIAPEPFQPRTIAPPIEPSYGRPDPSYGRPDPNYGRPDPSYGRPDPGYTRQDPAFARQYAALYGRVDGEPFPIPAIRSSDVDPAYMRTTVDYPTNEPPGTIIIDPRNRFLYLVQGGGRAIRYGVGVGRQGFSWSGTATIKDKQEWPDWYPPKEMLQRQPELMRNMSELRSGIGMPGGPRNPLGARAMYLWQGNKDTLFRIHGTFEPWTIGRNVSSGCIRMINQDVIDLYQRTSIGAKVVVL